jgi:hypothetical protein
MGENPRRPDGRFAQAGADTHGDETAGRERPRQRLRALVPCLLDRGEAGVTASRVVAPAWDEIQAHRTVVTGAGFARVRCSGPLAKREESGVDEETFNLSVRKFLKTLG